MSLNAEEPSGSLSKRFVPYKSGAVSAFPQITGPETLKSSLLQLLDESLIENIKLFQSHPLAQYTIVGEHETSKVLYAIASQVMFLLKKTSPYRPICSGTDGSEWIVVDAEDLVLHLFTKEAREFYKLEGLLAEASEEIAL